MAAEVGATADPDDLLMFLDGDAFPIADVMPVVHRALDQMVLIAVRRDENNGDKQPHPCFSMIRVRDWQGLRGDWTFGQGVPVVRTALGMANRIRYKWWKNKQIAENRRPLAQVFAQLETDPEFYRQFQ